MERLVNHTRRFTEAVPPKSPIYYNEYYHKFRWDLADFKHCNERKFHGHGRINP